MIVDVKNSMVGLRLRQGNIQIGHSKTLQRCFKEERGINYFIGEVHAVSKELIPNSQRDYFNENQTRNVFEVRLREICNKLQSYYYESSKCRAAIRDVNSFTQTVSEIKEEINRGFEATELREKAKERLSAVTGRKNTAEKRLEKFRETAESPDTDPTKAAVIHAAQEGFDRKQRQAAEKAEQERKALEAKLERGRKMQFTDKLPNLTKKEKEIVNT